MAFKSDRLKIALQLIGKSLFHAPIDSSGFWIDFDVADFLDSESEARRGFEIEAFNSRGVRTVDPTGNKEIEIAKKYEGKAFKTEEEGFINLATTLREIAENYRLEAQRVIEEYSD